MVLDATSPDYATFDEVTPRAAGGLSHPRQSGACAPAMQFEARVSTGYHEAIGAVGAHAA